MALWDRTSSEIVALVGFSFHLFLDSHLWAGWARQPGSDGRWGVWKKAAALPAAAPLPGRGLPPGDLGLRALLAPS